jgi:hypothetical protein
MPDLDQESAPASAPKLNPLILEATPRDPDAISSYYLWFRVMTEVLNRIPDNETDTYRLDRKSVV